LKASAKQSKTIAFIAYTTTISMINNAESVDVYAAQAIFLKTAHACAMSHKTGAAG
jgi:hypothetical protein